MIDNHFRTVKRITGGRTGAPENRPNDATSSSGDPFARALLPGNSTPRQTEVENA